MEVEKIVAEAYNTPTSIRSTAEVKNIEEELKS